MQEKTGIYVPLVTPFTADGEVDYNGLARATKFVLAKGADGIYACGGTSEFSLLKTEERKKCLETIIQNADGAEVIAHVGAAFTAEAVELAIHAEKAGTTMLSAVAPYYFGYSFAQVKEYFHAVAHATGLPLMIYNAAQARAYTLAELKELLQDEKITAVKYTGFNFYMLERLITAFPEKNFFTGADEAFLCGQVVGAHGAIGTTFNFFADKYIESKQLFRAGKHSEALDIVRKINSVTEAIVATDNLIALTKYVMTLQGLDILPVSRAPFSVLSDESKASVKSAYENAIKE